MLRLLQVGNQIPYSWPVDPSAEFLPGMIGQLTVLGSNIVCGVSDGSAPLGIIDDINTRAFYTAVMDEIVITSPIVGVQSGGQIITPTDVRAELKNANILSSSFFSNPVDVELIPVNGVVIFLAGTVLNFDADGDGVPDSIRTVVRYRYQVPNVMGDSSVRGSHQITIWFGRIIFATDQYETNVSYPLNSNLFVSPEGLLTTKQYSATNPGVAIVTAPPTAVLGSLEAIWL